MPSTPTTQRLQEIRIAFVAMRKRYIVLLGSVFLVIVVGQYEIQKKLNQIGITYEALNELQQLYELGSLMKPKGLMIAASTTPEERAKSISDFSQNVQLYLDLFGKIRYNSDYHEVFGISDTVKQRIFRLDGATSLIRTSLPISSDTISLDTTFIRITTILSVQSRAEQELSVFVYGYKSELQKMRAFVQWLSLGGIAIIVLALGWELAFILLPSRNTTQTLFKEVEESQKNLETALKKVSDTRSRYELLFNQAHDCVYQLDGRGRFVFANTAAQKLLGYDSAMLAETYYLDYVHPDYRRSVTVEYLRTDQEGKPSSSPKDTLSSVNYSKSMSFPIVNANGTTRWVEQSFTKLYDNEMFVGYLGIARDVTERQEIQQYLEELVALHSLVLENISSAVISCDLQGVISVFNNAAEYMLGYSADEVIGEKTIIELFTLDDLYAKKKALLQSFGKEISSDLETFFLTAEHFGNYIQRSTLRSKHGSSASADMRIRLLKDSAGVVTGLLLTAQDVSDVQQLEQIKQDFISRVSHEMRTPLHGIMGMIEILQTSELNEEQRSMVDIAQAKSDVLLTLINDILEYSKIQSGALEIQNAHADMSILVSNISEVLQYRLFAKGIGLEIQLAPNTPPMLYCDPVRLYQIILNLCDNLIQFSEGGTLHIDIEYLEKSGGQNGLSLSLYILGGSVNQDIQRKVFAPFVDENSNKEMFHPAGLQITLLRGIVQQMGGVLWLENDLEKKSVFHIFLTIDNASAMLDENISSASNHQHSKKGFTPEVVSETVSSSNKGLSAIQHSTPQGVSSEQYSETTLPRKIIRILVVDDDQDNRSLAESFVMQSAHPLFSYQLTFAKNGEEAHQLFGEQLATAYPFDLVLMDIQMPVMDGFEATKSIRLQENAIKKSRVPIIAITANAMENYREKCLAVGMNDYLAKPVKKKQLNDMIEKWLEHRKNILLVDDSEDFRLIMQLQLEKEQRYNLFIASNGQEAIELFQEHDIDAVIMDMEMPIVNGYEATKILRQMPKGFTIPILAMTGHNGEKEILRTLEVGCTKCFTKEGLETIRQVVAELTDYFSSPKLNA